MKAKNIKLLRIGMLFTLMASMIVTTIDAIRRDQSAFATQTTKKTLIDKKDMRLTTDYVFDVEKQEVIWTVDFKSAKNDKPRLFSLNLASGDKNKLTVNDFKVNDEEIKENIKDQKNVFERAATEKPTDEESVVAESVNENSDVNEDNGEAEATEIKSVDQAGTNEVSTYKDSYTYLDAATTDKQDFTITFTTPLVENASEIAVKLLPRLVEYADEDTAKLDVDGQDILPVNKNKEPESYVITAEAPISEKEEVASSEVSSSSEAASSEVTKVADNAEETAKSQAEPVKESATKSKKPQVRNVLTANPVEQHLEKLLVNRVQILQNSFTDLGSNGLTDQTKFSMFIGDATTPVVTFEDHLAALTGGGNNTVAAQRPQAVLMIAQAQRLYPNVTGVTTAANTLQAAVNNTGVALATLTTAMNALVTAENNARDASVLIREKYDKVAVKADGYGTAANIRGGYHEAYTRRGLANGAGQSAFLVEFPANALSNNPDMALNISYNNVGVYYDNNGVSHPMGAILTIKDIEPRQTGNGANADGTNAAPAGIGRAFIDIPNNLFSGIDYVGIQNLTIQIRYYSQDASGHIDKLLDVIAPEPGIDDPKLKSWTTFGSLNNHGAQGTGQGYGSSNVANVGIQGWRYAEAVKKLTDVGNADLQSVKSIGSLMKELTAAQSAGVGNVGWNKAEYIGSYFASANGNWNGISDYPNSLPGSFGDFFGSVDFDRASVSFQVIGTMNEFYLKSGTGNTWQTINSGFTRPIAPRGPFKTVSSAKNTTASNEANRPGSINEVDNAKMVTEYAGATVAVAYQVTNNGTTGPAQDSNAWITPGQQVDEMIAGMSATQYLWVRRTLTYVNTSSTAMIIDHGGQGDKDRDKIPFTAPGNGSIPAGAWMAHKPEQVGKANTVLWKRTFLDGNRNNYVYDMSEYGLDTFGPETTDAYYYDNLNIYRGGELLSNKNATPTQGNNTPFFYDIHQPTYANPDDSVAKPHDITMYDLLPAGIVPYQVMGLNYAGEMNIGLNSAGSSNFTNTPDATNIYNDLIKINSMSQEDQTQAIADVLDKWFGISDGANAALDNRLLVAGGSQAIDTALRRWRTAWTGEPTQNNNNTPRLWNNAGGLGAAATMTPVTYGAGGEANQRSIPRVGRVNVGTASNPEWRYLVVWSISDYEISQLNFNGEAFTFRLPVVAASAEMPNKDTWYDFINGDMNSTAVRFDLSDPEAEWHWQGNTPPVLSRYSYLGNVPTDPTNIQLRKTWYDSRSFTSFNNRPEQVYFDLIGDIYDVVNEEDQTLSDEPSQRGATTRTVALQFQGSDDDDRQVKDPHWETVIRELPTHPRIPNGQPNAGQQDLTKVIKYRVVEQHNAPVRMSDYREIDYDDSDDTTTVESGEQFGQPYDDDDWVKKPFTDVDVTRPDDSPVARNDIDRRVAITNAPNDNFVDLGVRKEWLEEDENGVARVIPAAELASYAKADEPLSITLQLTRDGVAVPAAEGGRVTVRMSDYDKMVNGEKKTFDSPVLGAWSTEWRDLPRTDADWVQYKYAVYEVAVNDNGEETWSPVYSEYNDEQNGYDQRIEIDNYKRELPENIPLTGMKYWIDDLTIRPSAINVRLYASVDGQRVNINGIPVNGPSGNPLQVMQPNYPLGGELTYQVDPVTTLNIQGSSRSNYWNFKFMNAVSEDGNWPTKLPKMDSAGKYLDAEGAVLADQEDPTVRVMRPVRYELEEDNVNGYRLLNTEQDLQFTPGELGDSTDVEQSFTITNQQRYPNSSTVHLNKVDKDTGEQLTDVRFRLETWTPNENSEGGRWTEIRAGQTVDGLFNYNSLPAGLYRISEETTNAGYQVLKGKIYFNMITSTATANAGDVVLDTRVGHRMFVDLDGADLSATDRASYMAVGNAAGLTFTLNNDAHTKNTVRQWMQMDPGTSNNGNPAIITNIPSQWDGGRITRIHSVQGVSIELENRKPIAPPETGGLGIIVFVLLGLTLSLVGFKYFDARRQRTIK